MSEAHAARSSLRRRAALAVLGLAVALVLVPAGVGGPLAPALMGARSTVSTAALGAALGVLLGAVLAALGLSFGARGRLFATRVAEALIALPTVLVVPLLAAAPLGPPFVRIAVALALARAGEAMHLVLLEARALSAERWVEASLALGARRRDLVRTHVAPRLAPLLVASSVAGLGAALPLEVAVSFLGLAPSTGLGAYAAAALAEGRVGPLVVASLAVLTLSLACAFLARDLGVVRARA